MNAIHDVRVDYDEAVHRLDDAEDRRFQIALCQIWQLKTLLWTRLCIAYYWGRLENKGVTVKKSLG